MREDKRQQNLAIAVLGVWPTTDRTEEQTNLLGLKGTTSLEGLKIRIYNQSIDNDTAKFFRRSEDVKVKSRMCFDISQR